MKRFLMGVVVAITAATLGPVAPSAAAPGEDRVVGTGQGSFPTDFGAFPSHAHVNAKGDAQTATGHAWARFDTPVGEVLIKGTPYCVDAVGNQAVVGFVVGQSNIGLVPVGTRILRKVIDNGEGRKDPPDQTGTTFAPPNTTTCPPGATPLPAGAVEQGNFVVDDGAPAPPPPSGTVFTDPGQFAAAIADLGDPTVIDFDEIDASPCNNTWVGRTPFDGNTYSGLGVQFSNPNAYPLFIAPGCLFWNASNSLSVRQFPFDDNADDGNDDDLIVDIDPSVAVGFELVDNGSSSPGEFIRFLDGDGNVVAQAPMPPDYAPFRAFIGIVSEDQPIERIEVVEDLGDGDDVDYDEFTLVFE